MKNQQPHIITEKGVEYHLGTMDGNQIHYDFQKILIYLDHKCKLLFGKSFKIYEEDEVVLFKLCIYFIKDHENCQKLNIEPNKGVLLTGPVGCGKTSLMKPPKTRCPSCIRTYHTYHIYQMGRFTNCLNSQRSPDDWRRSGYIVIRKTF